MAAVSRRTAVDLQLLQEIIKKYCLPNKNNFDMCDYFIKKQSNNNVTISGKIIHYKKKNYFSYKALERQPFQDVYTGCFQTM